MRNFTKIAMIGVLMMLSTTGCANDTRVKAMEKLKQLKAEDFFSGQQNSIEFAKAIEQGNIEKIQEMIGNGIDLKTWGEDGMNFLIWSFVKMNKKSYQYLLEHGADPNMMTVYGSTMYFASVADDPFWLKLALQHRGNPNKIDVDSEAIIFKAIRQERIENIKLLIEAGANINYQDKISKDTPMMEALFEDNYDIVYLLLEKGADPTIENKVNHDLIYLIKDNIVAPGIKNYREQVEWRKKVINLLEAKGFKF